MKKISKIIDKCQFSNKKDLIRVLSLGFLPGVNQMQKVGSYKNFEYFFPTNLVFSPSSKLFQIDNIVDKNSVSEILPLYEQYNKDFKRKF